MPSNFTSGAPDSAFWFVELPDGVWRMSWRGYEFTRRVQAILGVTQDGAWGTATLRALDERLRASNLSNAVRYADGFNPDYAGVTDATLRAAIWLFCWTDAYIDVVWGRIRIPLDTVLPRWRVAPPHPAPDQVLRWTSVPDAMSPFAPSERSVPSAVIQQAAANPSAPAPTSASETPTGDQLSSSPVLRPVGLPPAPLPVRSTGVSAVAVVAVVGTVLVLGAIAVSLSAPTKSKRDAARASIRTTRAQRGR